MYQDRKRMKYLAFDTLSSSASELEKVKYKKFARGRKILSEDKAEEINKIITTAYRNHLPIAITYYNHGYPKTITGKIKFIDVSAKTMILTNRNTVSFYDIEHISLMKY
jgi:hypothetical protein